MKRIAIVLAILPLSGCIWDPASRTNQESNAVVSLDGYSPSAGETVNFSVTNRDTSTPDSLWSTTSASTASFSSPYPFYAWSDPITFANDYWSPQWVSIAGVHRNLNGLAHSPGRLELVASSGGTPYDTFTAAAKTCTIDAINAGSTVYAAGESCSDGTSLVLFDNDGVGNGAPPSTWSTGWTTLYNGTNPPPGVAWEIGQYQVQDGAELKHITGLFCHPTSGGTHKAMIINHGLSPTFSLDDGSLTLCTYFAGQGYVTAMPAFRGQGVTLTGVPTYWSGGNVELCLGEVTDTMQLTTLVLSRSDVDPTKVVMWGHSHGACVTERAVEQGAPVQAAAAFSAPTDMAAWYGYCLPGSLCDQKVSGNDANIATTLGDTIGPVTPDQSTIPYDWRSPVTFAADLTARKDVKMLLLQGGSDPLIEPSQACELAVDSAGSSSVNYYIDAAGDTLSGPPSGFDLNCPGACGCGCNCDPDKALSWQPPGAGLPLGSWPASRYLLVYQADDHETILFGNPWNAFLNWLTKAL